MEKGTMFSAEGVSADQGFDVLDQWLQVVQQATQEPGFLEKWLYIFQKAAKELDVLEESPQIVQQVADILNSYKMLKGGKIGRLIGDFDVSSLLDNQVKYLIKLSNKCDSKEGLINSYVVEDAVDIAIKACLVMGRKTGVKSVEFKDLSKLKEQEEYVKIIYWAIYNFNEYVIGLSKRCIDNKFLWTAKDEIKKIDLENILSPEALKHYNFCHKFLHWSLKWFSNYKGAFHPETMISVVLAIRLAFLIGLQDGLQYAQSQEVSQQLKESPRRPQYKSIDLM